MVTSTLTYFKVKVRTGRIRSFNVALGCQRSQHIRCPYLAAPRHLALLGATVTSTHSAWKMELKQMGVTQLRALLMTDELGQLLFWCRMGQCFCGEWNTSFVRWEYFGPIAGKPWLLGIGVRLPSVVKINEEQFFPARTQGRALRPVFFLKNSLHYMSVSWSDFILFYASKVSFPYCMGCSLEHCYL